jgi:hypothetical protein
VGQGRPAGPTTVEGAMQFASRLGARTGPQQHGDDTFYLFFFNTITQRDHCRQYMTQIFSSVSVVQVRENV